MKTGNYAEARKVYSIQRGPGAIPTNFLKNGHFGMRCSYTELVRPALQLPTMRLSDLVWAATSLARQLTLACALLIMILLADLAGSLPLCQAFAWLSGMQDSPRRSSDNHAPLTLHLSGCRLGSSNRRPCRVGPLSVCLCKLQVNAGVPLKSPFLGKLSANQFIALQAEAQLPSS